MTSGYKVGDTIAALATPPGEGGVAIIRISGPKAILIADRVFSGDVKRYESHKATYGWVQDSNGTHVDDALCLVMKGGRSYTGEESVEIQCHGGSYVSRRVLELVLQSGARAAGPGEFTYRAYLNGRIDLAQAEAVQELIAAKNDLALKAAQDRLAGKLSDKISSFQKRLTGLTAVLEAWVDFPEEGLEFASQEELVADLTEISSEVEQLVASFHDGRLVQEGVALCLIGCPNVGKSSLMNTLLENERAIVTHIPGTTRDLIEDSLTLNGLHLRLVDTAGIRDVEEVVEQEGIRRSYLAMESADLVLFVIDASEHALSGKETDLLKSMDPNQTIVIWNKCDLVHSVRKKCSLPYQIDLSAREGDGIEQLKELIHAVVWKEGPPSQEEIMITSLRHKEALESAGEHLIRLRAGLLSNVSPEFLTCDARGALTHLSSIIGSDITEEVLSAIFSRFCIGK